MAAPELTLLVNFAILLVAAEFGALLFGAIRLPRVVGMLAGGILVGPGVNPWAGALDLNAENVRDIAFLGSIFLMFSIGLTFNPRSFRQVTGRALVVAIVAASASLLLGFGIALAFGRNEATALFIGLVLAPTSSTIGLRLADDMNLLGARGIETTMAAIVYDDVIALLLATIVLTVLAGAQASVLHVTLNLSILLLLAFVIILVGVQALPRALDLFGRFQRANPALVIMSFGLFIAWLFTLLSLPPIFGAFWAGTMVAATRFGPEMRTFLKPVTELFSAVFFAAIGLLIVPGLLVGLGGLIALLLLAAVVAKFFGGFAVLRGGGVPVYPALMCATLLVPRGEVSLVIAQYAPVGVDQQELQVIGGALMFTTTLLTPILANGIRSVFVARRRPRPAAPTGPSLP